MAATPETLEVLRDLSRFVAAHPPQGGFASPVADNAAAPLYLHEGQRFIVTMERASDMGGLGMWRSDALADAGVYCAEHDSQQFADGLVERLADHLSIRNLEHIVAAFQRELDQQNARRTSALASQNTTSSTENP